jgi:TolB-like protein
MLVNERAKWPHLEVISREALGPVLREQWLQQKGFSSPANPVGLGRLKGVRYLIQGIFYAQYERITVDLLVIDVETGVVAGSITSHGVEADIPSVKQDLVTQILRIFDPSLHRNTLSNSGETEKEGQITLREQIAVKKGVKNALSSEPNPFHSIDTLLSFEKLHYERREAYHFAETIWNEGWVLEIGQPYYHIWKLPTSFMKTVPIMDIPVSLFFSPHRLVESFGKKGKTAADIDIHVVSNGLQIFIEEGAGSHQIFVEHLHKPRRVFVRALNEQGDVLAIFSHWTWRTESKFHMPNSHRVSLPMWPEPFISGWAQFPLDWVEREGHHMTFDAGIFPVPDEHVLVVLEPLEESDEKNEKVNPDQPSQDEILLQTLEKSIRSHWAPAITEALPIPGYLPGNKRTAVGVVQIENGTIVQLRFQEWPDEPYFLKSLHDLQSHLLGSCMTCRNSGPGDPPQYSNSFRFQLTLIKDIHALQLGSHFP